MQSCESRCNVVAWLCARETPPSVVFCCSTLSWRMWGSLVQLDMPQKGHLEVFPKFVLKNIRFEVGMSSCAGFGRTMQMRFCFWITRMRMLSESCGRNKWSASQSNLWYLAATENHSGVYFYVIVSKHLPKWPRRKFQVTISFSFYGQEETQQPIKASFKPLVIWSFCKNHCRVHSETDGVHLQNKICLFAREI